jgi:hypothetical protein
MGNKQSTKNDQEPIQQMCNLGGFNFDEETPIWKNIYIQPLIREQENGEIIHEFILFHKSKSGVMTPIHSFETFHPLKKKCIIDESNHPIISFHFETDSFESDSNQMIIVSLDFSRCFHDINAIEEELVSMPVPVSPNQMMTMLKSGFFFHVVQFCDGYRIYIISSQRKHKCFESIIGKGDRIIGYFFIESSEVPILSKKSSENDDCDEWVIEAGHEKIEFKLSTPEEESGEEQISVQPQSVADLSHLAEVFCQEFGM